MSKDSDNPGTEELFPDVVGEDATYKPNVVATAKKLDKVEGEVYGLSVPTIFPSKHEEMYLAQNIVKSLEEQGFSPVDQYIIFKQLESMAKQGQEQTKDHATDYVQEFGITHSRGVKISMRGPFGGFEYDPDVETQREALKKQIEELENRLNVLETSAKQSGKAKKLPGKKGIAITFRQM